MKNAATQYSLVFLFAANLLAVLLICYTRPHRFLVVMFLEDEPSAAVATRVHSRRILSHNTLDICSSLHWHKSVENIQFNIVFFPIPSVLWRCWLGGRKGIRPVKNWLVGCRRGYVWKKKGERTGKIICFKRVCLQWFDAVGWAAGRASGL